MLIHDHTVISMSPNQVRIQGRISQTGWSIRDSYRDVSMMPPCAHDLAEKVEIKLTMSQWTHVASRVQRFIIVQGHVISGMTPTIDASCNHSGIVADPTCRHEHDPNKLHFFELFAGGFSGWSQVTHFLDSKGHGIAHKLAVDIDPECQSNYVHSYGVNDVFGPGSFECTLDELPSKSFVQADVRHHGWLHLLGHQILDGALASPPCPAWSSANQAAGLGRRDGQLTAECFGIIAVTGPRCFGFEMVSGIQHHVHWRALTDLLCWFGYEIRWMTCLDLAQQLPQHRQRLLMIAVRHDCQLNPHFCVKWCTGPEPSMHSHGILMEIGDPWKHVIFPSGDILRKYLQELMLPRDRSTSQPPFKKLKSQPLNRRVKFDHETVDCVMASYSKGHELPKSNLLNFGLYGSLVHHENQLRFLQIPEILALFGAIGDFDASFDFATTIHQLGNAIAVPHAAITICNMLAFFRRDLGSADVQDLCQQILEARLHSGNMSWVSTDRGFRFFRDDECIPPTIPFHEFCHVKIHDRDNVFTVLVEKKIDLWDALTLLFGDVTMLGVFALCQDRPGIQIPITKPFPALTDALNIQVDMPAVLLVSEQIIRQTPMSTPCSLILTRSGPVILHMGPTVERALEIVADVYDAEFGVATNLLGMPCDHQLITPYCFMELPEPIVHVDITALEMVTFQLCGSAMFVSGSPSAIQDFRTFLSNSHCDDFMNRLGWHFVIPISCNDLLNPETIMMTKCPDRCAISTQDAARALATFAFLLQIRARSQIGSPPFIPCQFQLFNDYVWKGQIGTGMTLEHFDHAWTRSCRIFSEELPLRYIVFGKQMPIDMSFAQFLNESLLDGREMRIHTILRLTGGGPINLVPNEQSLEQDAQASSSRAATGSDDRHDLFYLDKHYFEDAIQMAVTQWRTLPGQKDDMKSSDYLSMQCNVQDGMLIWSDSLDILFSFVRDIKENAIELMLDRMGWMMAIQFVAWEDPIVARLIMFPRPTGQVTSLGLARHFLQKALLRYALPYDSQHDIESRALIRVHSAGNSLAQLAVNRSMRVSELTDSWEHSCQIVGFDPAIRILICGKQASREFLLSDYAKVNENGDMFAYIHFVNPLKGGGPGPSDTPSSAKNHLASVLLEEGANIAEVSTFVSALGKSGPMAIAAVLAPKDRDQRIKAIQKLANSLSIDMPALHTKEKFVKKKIQQHVHSAESLDICQLCIQQGFFRNEDGTPAQQRECPTPGEAGISLVTSKTAGAWIGNVLSADEQMMLVLGPCPAEDTKACKKLRVPMYFKNEPIIVACCAHQLGQKLIKVDENSAKDIPTSESIVFSVTVFKDEVPNATWDSLTETPVKTAMALLFPDADPPTLVCPPWGRTWHNAQGKPDKIDPFFSGPCANPSRRHHQDASCVRSTWSLYSSKDRRA